MIIPFFLPHAGCPHRCVFCDQKRITGRTAAPDPASVPATIRAYLASRRQGRDSQREPVQVAFFGGSFTALPREIRQAYLEQLRPFIDSGDVRSVRISTRPDALSPDLLSFLTRYLVTTVELGAQSMDDEVLHRSGRGHTAEHTRQAVRLLRERGFAVGIQLMPGLPGDRPATFLGTVETIIGLEPDLVRIYPAVVISGTPLERLYRDGKYHPLALDDAIELCAEAVKRFRRAGIEVARLGLQSTDELERPGTIVAGPWHPAFGQLVASRRFLAMMRQLLTANSGFDLLVHPDDLSTALGQHRKNLTVLAAEFGHRVRVMPDPSIPRGDVMTTNAGWSGRTSMPRPSNTGNSPKRDRSPVRESPLAPRLRMSYSKPVIRTILISLALLLSAAGPLVAGEEKEIELSDGSVITGEVVSMIGGVYTIRSGSLGSITVPDSKVRSIRQKDAALSSSSGVGGQVRPLQERMESDPAVMERIRGLKDDPDFRMVLEDPEIMRAVETGDIAALMANPRFLQLMHNPAVRDIQNRME
jgi:radical SAM superfamily enzyme